MADDLQPNQVRLGGSGDGRVYTLHPQRIGRIGRKLPQVFEMFAMASGAAPVATDVGPRLYDALKVFIPELEPFWSLAGYPSEAAWEKRVAHEKEVEKQRKAHVTKWWGKLDDEVKRRYNDQKPPFEALPVPVAMEFTPPEFDDPRDAPDAVDMSPRPDEIMDAIEVIFKLHGGQRLVRLLKNFMSPEAIRGTIERAVKRMQIESALRQSRNLQLASGGSATTSSTTRARTPENGQTGEGLDSLLVAS